MLDVRSKILKYMNFISVKFAASRQFKRPLDREKGVMNRMSIADRACLVLSIQGSFS